MGDWGVSLSQSFGVYLNRFEHVDDLVESNRDYITVLRTAGRPTIVDHYCHRSVKTLSKLSPKSVHLMTVKIETMQSQTVKAAQYLNRSMLPL